MTMIAALLLVLVVALYVSLPLLREASATPLADNAPPELWAREKGVALLAIKEAEFDHATGKLDEADYAVLRSAYEERAVHAMQALDREAASEAPAAPSGPESGLRSFCTSCGRQAKASDRFCAGCGAAMAAG